MTGAYSHLLSPGRIGSLELRNRILMCPMGDTLADPDGTVSDAQLAYYEARARGGAGLLLVGSVSIAYPAGSYHHRQTAISAERHEAGLSELTDRAHRHGARIAPQLVHDGANSLNDIAEGRPMLVPSIPPPTRPDRLMTMVSAEEASAMMQPFMQPTSSAGFRVADEADIAWVIEQFVIAAERAQRVGFDGVELHAGHGYLLDAFLSPAANARTDGWGGPVENRARLLCDVVRAIRGRLGRSFPLWCRLNAVEKYKERGETLEDTLRVIELGVDAGLDAVHVSAYANPGIGVGITETHTPHSPGALVAFAEAAKQRVNVPIITFGRIEPDLAEAVIAEGKADFVAMGRQLLADPELPNKLAQGRPTDVRPCIYQYRCIGNIFLRGHVACVANAATGREHEEAVGVSPHPRHVLVVGGGPAGMEAARTLSARGHRVTLCEAGTELGGRLLVGAAVDDVLARFLDWLGGQVQQAGVDVRLSTRLDDVAITALGADHVVIATGAAWDGPDVPTADPALVWSVDQYGRWLMGGTPAGLGQRVAVLGGGKTGLSVARHLAGTGREVTVIHDSTVFAAELGIPGRARWVADVEALGVRLVASFALESFGAGRVIGRVADEACEVLVDRVIVARARAAGTSPMADGSRARTHVVGDARDPRGVEGATADAFALAHLL